MAMIVPVRGYVGDVRWMVAAFLSGDCHLALWRWYPPQLGLLPGRYFHYPLGCFAILVGWSNYADKDNLHNPGVLAHIRNCLLHKSKIACNYSMLPTPALSLI